MARLKPPLIMRFYYLETQQGHCMRIKRSKADISWCFLKYFSGPPIDAFSFEVITYGGSCLMLPAITRGWPLNHGTRASGNDIAPASSRNVVLAVLHAHKPRISLVDACVVQHTTSATARIRVTTSLKVSAISELYPFLSISVCRSFRAFGSFCRAFTSLPRAGFSAIVPRLSPAIPKILHIHCVKDRDNSHCSSVEVSLTEGGVGYRRL